MDHYLWCVEHGVLRSCKGDNGGGLTSKWVSLLLDGDVKGYVLELHSARFFGDDEGVEWVPFSQKGIL